jgi:hypothetical protein
MIYWEDLYYGFSGEFDDTILIVLLTGEGDLLDLLILKELPLPEFETVFTKLLRSVFLVRNRFSWLLG